MATGTHRASDEFGTDDWLNPSECWNLLRTVDVGRLALVRNGAPEITPINFVVDRGTVVFRTASGTKLATVSNGRHVAFEADCGPLAGRSPAWSVVIKGRATLIHPGEFADSIDLPLYPLHPGAKPCFVRIEPIEITGRRFDVADAAHWRTPLTGARPVAPE